MKLEFENRISSFLSGAKRLGSKIPVIKNIPFYNTLPVHIQESEIRYFKLSNLVLTLGMFVHFSWIFLFYFFEVQDLLITNSLTIFIYIGAIYINRKGHYLIASVIMVSEIILHQFFSIYLLGLGAGFQYYIMVIALLPFLMPRGNWIIKLIMLFCCISSFIYIDYHFNNSNPKYQIEAAAITYLRISNILFSFISLCLSGRNFVMAMHETEDKIKAEKNRSENLLLNILPEETAEELKVKGSSTPKLYSWVTVMFTDFTGFTDKSSQLNPIQLIGLVNKYFKVFDEICTKYEIEKIKTIGDAYLCVCGLPRENKFHAIQITKAALEMAQYVNECKLENQNAPLEYFDIRIGIHSGPVVAGIVGIKKFQYDIWGDTVNTASRMESYGAPGKVNISDNTYLLLKNCTEFEFENRGAIAVKGKGEMNMWFVKSNNT